MCVQQQQFSMHVGSIQPMQMRMKVLQPVMGSNDRDQDSELKAWIPLTGYIFT